MKESADACTWWLTHQQKPQASPQPAPVAFPGAQDRCLILSPQPNAMWQDRTVSFCHCDVLHRLNFLEQAYINLVAFLKNLLQKREIKNKNSHLELAQLCLLWSSSHVCLSWQNHAGVPGSSCSRTANPGLLESRWHCCGPFSCFGFSLGLLQEGRKKRKNPVGRTGRQTAKGAGPGSFCLASAPGRRPHD
jgi:hypothetical protein